jgi:hypothetical protein
VAGECQPGEYVAGVAESHLTGALTRILCCTGTSLVRTACNTVLLSANNTNELGWTDVGAVWEVNTLASRSECRAGHYLVGVSRTSTGVGHAIRCCGPQ